MRLPPGGCHVAHSLCSGMPFSPVRSNAVVQPLSLVTESGGGDRSSPRWSNAVSWFHKGHGRRYDSVSRWTCSIDGSRGSIQSIDGGRNTARPQAAIREFLPLVDSHAQRRGRLRFRPAPRPRHSPAPRSSPGVPRAFNPNPPQGYTPAGQGRGAGGFASGSAGATLESGGRRDTVPRRRAPPARRQARPSRRAVHRRYGPQAGGGSPFPLRKKRPRRRLRGGRTGTGGTNTMPVDISLGRARRRHRGPAGPQRRHHRRFDRERRSGRRLPGRGSRAGHHRAQAACPGGDAGTRRRSCTAPMQPQDR